MLRAAIVLALVVMTVPVVLGFSSLPPGSSPHDDITAEGARRAGFEGEAVEALQQATREPDFQESEYDPQLDEPTRTDGDHEYEPDHHCDRVAPATDLEAFNATVAYIGRQRSEAANASAAGEVRDAVAHLGRALHAIQDCYSHTNVVDLGPSGWLGHHEALLGDWPPVDGLRLVAYDPGADEPGDPDGDPYGHDAFAKDSADMNDESKARLPDGRTKFEAARDLATNATAAFLQNFMGGLPGREREALMDAKPEDAGLPDDVPVPGLPLVAALLALTWTATRRR